MPERRFDVQALAIDSTLEGARLPSPARRGWAFVLDGFLLVLPTIAASLLFAGLALRLADPAGYRAVRTAVLAYPADPAAELRLLRDLAPVLVRIDADGLPAAVAAEVEAGELDRAAERLAGLELLVALDLGGGEGKPLPPGTVRLPVERLIPGVVRAAALFFVPGLYFAVTTALWGATLGKRICGLRVVRLDGGKIGLFDAVERFGAYFGLLGTLGLGLFDLWRDPNRRLGHDRAVDTVVVRRQSRTVPGASAC